MKELLINFSIDQIAFFVIILAAAIKGIVSWIEWAIGKSKDKFEKEQKKEDIKEKIVEDIKCIKQSQKEMVEVIQTLSEKVNLLMDSDKDDIKAWITEKHHYYCYQTGYIDDYNLDCIEKRYKHYKDEGGNSFVYDLMNEIRALPKKNNFDFHNKINK